MAVRMVPLLTTPDPFEAKVLAVQLGAEGVLWELRGPGGAYPVGPSTLYVAEDDVIVAREVLASARPLELDPDDVTAARHRPALRWCALAGLVAVAAWSAGRVVMLLD